MTITVELSHYDLVNLFCGRPRPYGDNPYTKFTGNQWNDEWEWDREKIEKLSENDLVLILFGAK